MGARRLPTCKYCGRKFVPDARNRDRQQVCRSSACRLAASRAKKRRYYRRRLECEAGFREAERVRCREAIRLSRQSQPDPPPPGTESLCPHKLLTGLVSQLSGTSDPVEVAGMMSMYAERGRRLTESPQIRDSPS